VPAATTAIVEDDQVVCRSAGGNIVAMFEAITVAAYGVYDALRDPATVDVVLLRQPLPLTLS
jgi:hypothetical protein